MYKMIIVDDEDLVINGLTTLINWKEHQIEIVGTAKNGQKALELIKTLKPDIVLTDICMPGINGLQLIQKVKEEDSNTAFIIISGHAEFEFAKSAIELDVIDYLIKPVEVEEIVSVIKKSIKKNEKVQQEQIKQEQIKQYQSEMIEKYFLDLLLGLKSVDMVIEREYNEFTVFYIGFNQKEWLKDLDISRILYKVKSFMNDKGYRIFNYLIDEKITVINSGNNHNKKIESFLKDLRDILNWEVLEIPFIGIGNAYENPKDLPISLREAKEAFKKGLYFQQTTTHYNEIKNKDNQYLNEFSKKIVADFTNENINLINVTKCIDELIYYSRKYMVPSELFKKQSFEFITEIMNLIQQEYEVGVDDIVGGKYTLIQGLNYLTSINEIEQFLKNHISLVFRYIDNHRISYKDKLVLDIKSYLEENYEKSIQLDDLAGMFHINPSYLSSLFSKTVGKPISEFLLTIRMEKAKELLRNSDYRIIKISETVGYDNQRYFSHVFKKYVGTSPGEYRANHLLKK